MDTKVEEDDRKSRAYLSVSEYDKHAPVVREFDADGQIFEKEERGLSSISVRYATQGALSLTSSHIDHAGDLTHLPDEGYFLFFIKHTTHSHSRLMSTRSLFDAIIEKYSITPRFKEFVSSFTWQSYHSDYAPPGCRFRQLENGFEMCYGYRYTALRTENLEMGAFAVRQSAVYHKICQSNGMVVLILVAPSIEAKNFASSYIKTCAKSNSLCNGAFVLHAALLDSSLSKWRAYMIDLSKKVETSTITVLKQKQSERIGTQYSSPIQFSDRVDLKLVEERVVELSMMLTSILGTVMSVRACYDAPALNHNESFNVLQSFNEVLEQARLHLKSSEMLHEKVKSGAAILSDLLAYQNAMGIQNLAREATEDNIAIRRLTQKTTEDSSAIKALTVITMLFLPATFVADFFSTQFIHADANGFYFAPSVWIFFAISIPITAITFVGLTFLPNALARYHRVKGDAQGQTVSGMSKA